MAAVLLVLNDEVWVDASREDRGRLGGRCAQPAHYCHPCVLTAHVGVVAGVGVGGVISGVHRRHLPGRRDTKLGFEGMSRREGLCLRERGGDRQHRNEVINLYLA